MSSKDSKGQIPAWNEDESWTTYTDTIDMWLLSTTLAEEKQVGHVLLYGIKPNFPLLSQKLMTYDARYWNTAKDTAFQDPTDLPAADPNIPSNTRTELGQAVRTYTCIQRLKLAVEFETRNATGGASGKRYRQVVGFKRVAGELIVDAVDRHQAYVLNASKDTIKLSEREKCLSLWEGLDLNRRDLKSAKIFFNPTKIGQGDNTYLKLVENLDDLFGDDEDKSQRKKGTRGGGTTITNSGAGGTTNGSGASSSNPGQTDADGDTVMAAMKAMLSKFKGGKGGGKSQWSWNKKNNNGQKHYNNGKNGGNKSNGNSKGNGKNKNKGYQKVFLADGTEVCVHSSQIMDADRGRSKMESKDN